MANKMVFDRKTTGRYVGEKFDFARNVLMCCVGDAPICGPKSLGGCAFKEIDRFVQTNMQSKCNCPRQCRKLSYLYTVTQAEYSDHAAQWIQSTYSPNITIDYIKRNYASLKVIC